MIYIAWNHNILESYLEQIYQFIFNLILIIPTLIFSNTKILNIPQSKKYDTLLLISIISTLASGLFYQLDFFFFKNFIFIIFLFILTLIFNTILKRTNRFLDIIFSLIIFILLSKIFLLSSAKDIFHYSWYLGPINSLNEYGHNLLDNVPSQYGYLNIILIHKLSLLTKLQSTDLLILMIFLFFIFFYVIFFKKIKSLINLPYSIVALFLSILVFANVGFNTLSGAMFIPSSSVYRFLPSLLAIIIFTKLINRPNYKNIFIFLLFFLISLLWSFESSFFTLFSLSAYFFVKFFYLIFISKKNELQNYLKRNLIKFLIFGLILFFFLSFFLMNKDVTLFYEYIINAKMSFLTKEIEPNKVTFLFLFLL